MKLFIVAGLLTVSGIAAAQTCKMELFSPRGQFITSIRTPNDPSCRQASMACDNWRRWYRAAPNSQCFRVRDNGDAIIDYVRHPDYDVYWGYEGSPYTRVPRIPVPNRSTPTPTPNPRPTPEVRPIPMPRPTPTVPNTPSNPIPQTTNPESDSTRAIEAGETVIFNSALHMVVSLADTNFYNLSPINGNGRGRDREVISDVARHYVAVTRGCHMGFCANDSVIVLGSLSYAAVAGIEYDGQFVLKTIDGRETLSFDVNGNSLAWTKGCTPDNGKKVCVGNVVMRQRSNVYYNVVGIQLDGNVVLENSSGAKRLSANINPGELLIVR